MILDLFAGAGGWDVAALGLGLDPIGIELDEAACATRAAAGLRTIRADVSTYPLEHLRGLVTGLIASPPCQAYSKAGKRLGLADVRGQLVYEVIRWADALRPRWIACEQVEDVAPIWRLFRDTFRCWGYNAWAGVLDAADYGVPQNRKRAVLIAHADRPVWPPAPTHSETGHDEMFDQRARWVSMADALGWGMTERPFVTVCSGSGGGPDPAGVGGSGARRSVEREREREKGGGCIVRTRGDSGRSRDEFDAMRQPSRTITGKSDSWDRGGGVDDEPRPG